MLLGSGTNGESNIPWQLGDYVQATHGLRGKEFTEGIWGVVRQKARRVGRETLSGAMMLVEGSLSCLGGSLGCLGGGLGHLLRFDEASGQILGNSEVSHRFVEVAVLLKSCRQRELQLTRNRERFGPIKWFHGAQVE